MFYQVRRGAPAGFELAVPMVASYSLYQPKYVCYLLRCVRYARYTSCHKYPQVIMQITRR